MDLVVFFFWFEMRLLKTSGVVAAVGSSERKSVHSAIFPCPAENSLRSLSSHHSLQDLGVVGGARGGRIYGDVGLSREGEGEQGGGESRWLVERDSLSRGVGEEPVSVSLISDLGTLLVEDSFSLPSYRHKWRDLCVRGCYRATVSELSKDHNKCHSHISHTVHT